LSIDVLYLDLIVDHELVRRAKSSVTHLRRNDSSCDECRYGRAVYPC
jgi:hypothetical protein